MRFAILEARPRVGGRAHTLGGLPHPLDAGCGWLHSADRNPFSRIAGALGFALDKTPPHWTRQMDGVGMSPADQAEYRKALAALEGRIAAAAAAGRDPAWASRRRRSSKRPATNPAPIVLPLGRPVCGRRRSRIER